MKRRLLFLAILTSGIMCFTNSDAVAQGSTVLDGLYVKEHIQGKRVIPYTHLREADVMWLKRVWRNIDLRQKANHVLYYPTTIIQDRQSLFEIIKDAILNEGTITAYDVGPVGTDDEFTMPMTSDMVRGMLQWVDTNYTEDLETGELVQTLVAQSLKTTDIKWYDMKEEWFFDRQKSVQEVRIIGICPMKEKKNDMGEVVGPQPLFWIYFPEARYVFAKADVYNRFNDAERRSYEDIFWKRQFSSYITKQTNVYDRFIIEYKMGLDALLEAEEVKKGIFLLEHDLWHF